MLRILVLLSVATMLSMAFLDAAAGQSAASERRTRPSEAGLEREFPEMTLPDGGPSPEEPPSPTGGITLVQALSLAFAHNPGLASFSLEVRAADAQALQAGLRPNPEFAVESENILGTGEFRGADLAETTLSVRQLIEIAGKRPKRARVALLERDLAGWDYESRKADVLADMAKSFIDVLEAQERAALTEDLLRLAEQVFEAVSLRVRAGKVSPVEETRTALARVVLPNPGGAVRPGLFVTGTVTVEDVPVPVIVPKTSIESVEEKPSVFVETEEGFVARPVTVGRSDGTHVEIASGLPPGTRYVKSGAFTLKAQLSKGAFGGGHAH